jgi:hypothetical protein
MSQLEYYEFIKKYEIILNKQQESAVLRTDGQTLLLAVPGSGKTTELFHAQVTWFTAKKLTRKMFLQLHTVEPQLRI